MIDREMERVREPEPAPRDLYDENRRKRAAWLERQQTGKLVVHPGDRPVEPTRQGFLKHYLDRDYLADTALTSWLVFVHDIRTLSGRHRHQGGFGLFVLDGLGATEVDGNVIHWEAGDLLLLGVKPGGLAHQHFNRAPGSSCRWAAFYYPPFQDHLVHHVEQLEAASELPSAGAPVAGSPGGPDRSSDGPWPGGRRFSSPEAARDQNLFDWMVAVRDWERRRRPETLSVVRGSDLTWEVNPLGVLQWYLHPALTYLSVTNLLFYRQRIAPGGRGGRVRHPGDAVFFVLHGRGYTLVDGVRHDWAADDVVQLPLRPGGVVFQHFNDGPGEAVLVGAEPNFLGVFDLDMGSGWEVLEPCPEYRGRQTGGGR